MEKTGRQRVKTERCDKIKRKCANCGGEGVYKVTYEDMYSKLTATLCEECAKLKYGQLKLQTFFKWPPSS